MELANFLQLSKPIVFDTGFDEFPYSGAGSGFLSYFQNRLYFVTALHVVRGEDLDRLMIFLNNETEDSIPFEATYQPSSLEGDYGDFIIMQVAMDKISMTTDSLAHAIRFDNLSSNWKASPDDYQFVFFGYPMEGRSVDYDAYKIIASQQLLIARLAGVGVSNHCFELEISDLNGVTDLNGFSGSPVIAVPRNSMKHSSAEFCGMLIQGSASSYRAHFIDANLIKGAFEKIASL